MPHQIISERNLEELRLFIIKGAICIANGRTYSISENSLYSQGFNALLNQEESKKNKRSLVLSVDTCKL